jgi:hypothetical protein
MRQFVLAAATVATLFASPALAQSFSPEIGSGNIVGSQSAGNQAYPSVARHAAGNARRASDALAQSRDFRSNYRWPLYDPQGRDLGGW